MGCNCKGQTIDSVENKDNNLDNKNGENIVKYFFKFLVFLLFVTFSPIILIGILWLIFKMIVLNDSVDVKPILIKLGKKFKNIDEDDDFDELTNDDVVMLNVEDITVKNNKD